MLMQPNELSIGTDWGTARWQSQHGALPQIRPLSNETSNNLSRVPRQILSGVEYEGRHMRSADRPGPRIGRRCGGWIDAEIRHWVLRCCEFRGVWLGAAIVRTAPPHSVRHQRTAAGNATRVTGSPNLNKSCTSGPFYCDLAAPSSHRLHKNDFSATSRHSATYDSVSGRRGTARLGHHGLRA